MNKIDSVGNLSATFLLCTVIAIGASACDAEDASDHEVAETTQPVLAEYRSPYITYDGANGPPTQCTVGGTTMHCCPPGKAMIGADVNTNVFKCGPLVVLTAGAPFMDAGTQRNGMHACPPNSVMIGLHANLNQLACQPINTAILTSETVDTNTRDAYPMRVCPNWAAMTGIRIDQDKLNCATDITMPPAPTQLTILGRTGTGLGSTLGFSVNANNPNLILADYELWELVNGAPYRRLSQGAVQCGNATCSAGATWPNTTSNDLFFNKNNPCIELRAFNTNGFSAFSNVACFSGSPPAPTASTVIATIDVDIGGTLPPAGCGSANFLLDGVAMTSELPMLRLMSGANGATDYHCVYSGFKSGVAMGSHRVQFPSYGSCQTVMSSSGTTNVMLSPSVCAP